MDLTRRIVRAWDAFRGIERAGGLDTSFFRDGIRVLAKGDITSKLDLKVAGASKSAIEAVEKAGGTLTVEVFYVLP